MCLGVPGRIVRVSDDDGLRMGAVDFGGITREVCLAYVPTARPGDYVVVHAGFAISEIDAAAAAATLALLAEIGDSELAALRGGGLMRYVDEYRDAALAQAVALDIGRHVTRPWTLMEVCGGQTHTILRYGIDELLPAAVTLVHGPGCPVCVTPIELIDQAIALAALPEVILCSFGDMLRVPGSDGDLFGARARGGDVRVLYSPLDAVALARREPRRVVVFFGVGFETTAPTTAMAVQRAAELGVANFALLAAHVRVPPAMEAILSMPDNRVQGFLAAGHVCTVMGVSEYVPLAARFRVPIVVTGFEPVDLLAGIAMCVRQLEAGRAEVENQYVRSVRPEGNRGARAIIDDVFEPVERRWRGLAALPASALALRERYAPFDALRRFGLTTPAAREPDVCRAGDVLRGVLKPPQCPAFGTRCTPDHPLGAPMVSSEGTCAAYHRAGRTAALEGGAPSPLWTRCA